jgi:hypothetical protein
MAVADVSVTYMPMEEVVMKLRIVLIVVLLPWLAYAGKLDDRVALGDLKSVKIICDVNVGEAKLLLRRLELIDETYTQLIDAGITPTIVVAFRGGASRYVTVGDKYVDASTVNTKREIQGWVDQFRQNGFRLEQCAIAANAQKVAQADLLAPIHVVQNGYISIAAYQNRGYALISMD